MRVELNLWLVIGWAILGLAAGFMARIAMGRFYSLIGDLILGVVGGLVGGFLVTLLYSPIREGGISSSLISAYAGAVMFLAARRAVTDRTDRPGVERPGDVIDPMPR